MSKLFILLSTLLAVCSIAQAQVQSSGNIPPAISVKQEKEIKDACDFASTVDLTELTEFPESYDEAGNRIPAPKNAQTAIARLEKLVATMPKYPEMAKVYFLLGKLKEKYANNYDLIKMGKSQEDLGRPPKDIEGHIGEYTYFESGAAYFYNNWHFEELLRLFPDSDFADNAAYELSGRGYDEVTTANEELNSVFYPMSGFIVKYPNSELVDKAVERIAKAFSGLTPGDMRLENKGWYFPKQFQSTVEQYEKTALKTPLMARAKAYDTLSEAWINLGNFSRAKELCEFIIKNTPKYSQIEYIKKRLSKLNNISFTLNPAETTDNSAKLTWGKPTEPVVSQYVIYRSTKPEILGVEIGNIPGTSLSEFTDTNLQHGKIYGYTVKGIGAGSIVFSNQSMATIVKRE